MAKRSGGRKAPAPPMARRSAAPRTAAKKKTTRRSTAKRRPSAARTAKSAPSALFAPIAGAERRDIGHVQLEVGRAGAARVKRMIYPPGFHWAADMKPVTGTEL